MLKKGREEGKEKKTAKKKYKAVECESFQLKVQARQAQFAAGRKISNNGSKLTSHTEPPP